MPTVIPAPPALAAKLAEQLALTNQVATLEEQLKDAKALLKQVEENELAELVTPDMLADDTLVQLGAQFYQFEQKYYCGVDAGARNEAHRWLEENGHGAMLKRSVTVSLPKDSRELVARLRALMAKFLPHFEVEVVVPPKGDAALKQFVEYLCAEAGVDKPAIEEATELPGATLSAFVRKTLKAGKQLPAFFNVYAPVKGTLASAPEVWQDADGMWWHGTGDLAKPMGPYEQEDTARESLTDWQNKYQEHPEVNV